MVREGAFDRRVLAFVKRVCEPAFAYKCGHWAERVLAWVEEGRSQLAGVGRGRHWG